MTLPLLPLLSIAYLAFSLVSATHALLNKRDPKAALGWIACCLLVPYLGPFLYAIFGINRTRVNARKMRPEPDDAGVVVEHPDTPEHSVFPLSIIGYNVTRKPLLPSAGLRMLMNGDEAYPLMLEAIQGAREKVYVATYIFGNGGVSDRFLDALSDAMVRGVEVKVILDGLGERMSFPRIGRKLKRRGIPFQRFNEFTLFPPSLHINLRNHRKILTVDGHTAFTGGMNIADANTRQPGGAPALIQDVHFRLEGGIAADLEYAFLKDWDYCCGKRESRLPPSPRGAIHNAGRNTIWTRLILDGPNEDMDKLSDILVGIISAAKSRVWIMTPYFLPDAEIIGALQAARLRNVQVKAVLPSQSNIPLTHWAARHMLWQMLDYGVEVLYQPSPFSHAKLLIVDDHYSLVGSANLDPRSLRLNFELSVEIFSRQVNGQLEAYFNSTSARAERCTRALLERRPLPVKIRDALAWLWTPYL